MGDSVALQPYGYVATMNAPIDDEDDKEASNYSRLRKVAMAEPSFFEQSGLGDLIASGHASAGHLITRVNTMFMEYVHATWVPTTIAKLLAEAGPTKVSLVNFSTANNRE